MSRTLAINKLDQHLFYQALLKVPHVVIIIDNAYQVQFSNVEKFSSFRNEEELIGKYIWDIYPEIDIQNLLLNVHEYNESAIGYCYKNNYDTKKWMKITVDQLKNDTGKSYYLILAEDSPEVHQMISSSENRNVHDEFLQYSNQNEKAQKEFIQIAAHELRTPLTSIKGFTQLVLERYKEREMKWFFQPTLQLLEEFERDLTFFKVILDEAIRLDEITDELLSMFKIEQGKLKLNYQPTDFSTLVQDSVNSYVIPNNFHNIQYTDHTQSAIIHVDHKKIVRVIHNLLSDAVKYSPHSADIFVTLEEIKGYLRLSVRDNGFGIPEDQQKHIFDRFFRAQSEEHDEVSGFGVGLYICQEIIKLHGGRLFFRSKYKEGSVFFFDLPLHE